LSPYSTNMRSIDHTPLHSNDIDQTPSPTNSNYDQPSPTKTVNHKPSKKIGHKGTGSDFGSQSQFQSGGMCVRIYCSVRACLCLVVLLFYALVMNLLQACTYVFVRPWSLYYSRVLLRDIAQVYAGLMVFILEYMSGSTLRFSGSTELWSESWKEDFFLLLSNHVSYADWPLMFMVLYRKRQAGTLRIFMKEIGKYLPGLGWGCAFHEFLFLKRSVDHDAPRIKQVLSSFRQTTNPLSIALFPEGTFADSNSHHLVHTAMDFAAKYNLIKPTHLLVPRVKGFYLAITELRSQVRYVLDLTVAFSGCRNPYARKYTTYLPLLDNNRHLPNVTDYINGCSAENIYVDIRVYSMSSIPTEEEGCKKWLYSRYAEKEELLTYFNENGHFPGDQFIIPLSFTSFVPYLVFWMLMTLLLRLAIQFLPSLWSTVLIIGAAIIVLLSAAGQALIK